MSKTDRKFNNKFLIYMLCVLVIGLLLCLNSSIADTITLNLAPKTQSENLTVMSPQLSLPAGEYKISGLDGENIFETHDGTFLAKGSGTIDLKLSKDYSNIVVKTTATSSQNITITSDGNIFNDTFVLALLIVLFLTYIGYIRFIKQENMTSAAVNIALIALAVFATYPVMSDYTSYGHDLNFHLYRIEGLKDGLLSGQFPVRIDPTHNNGYGYVTASVYPSLFLYIPALLRLVGVSSVLAYKIFLFAINLATAYTMYISAKKITNSTFAGMFSSVVYTLSTWRIINLIHRAAIGEVLAMVFFPVVILGLFCLLKGDKKKWWVFALGATGIFNSHMISCIFVVFLTAVMIIVFFKDFIKDMRWLGFVKAGVLTLLVNLWYLIPFLTFYMGTDLAIGHTPENTQYFQNAIFPAELFNIFNDKFGFSQLLDAGISGNMSLSLGVGVTFCLIIVILYFVFDKKEKIKDYSFHAALFMFGLFILFMTTTLFPSAYFQQSGFLNKIAGTIRMPWRFLSLASPIICITAAAVVLLKTKSEKGKQIVTGVTCLVCAIGFVFFGTAYSTTYNSYVKKGQAIPTDAASGWDNEYFIYRTNTNELTANKYKTQNAAISGHDKNATTINVKLSSAQNGGYVEVPLLFYPGYSAKDNFGNKLTVECGDNNVVRVYVTDSTKEFTVKYTGKPSFKIGCIITDLTLLAIIAYLLLPKFKKKHKA